MAASNLLVEVGDPGSATTLDANYTATDTTVTVVSTTNWPATGKAVIFAIDSATVVNGDQVQVAGTYCEFEGTVASSTSVTNVDYKRGDGDQNFSAGSLTRVYIPVSSERENRIVEWGSAEHNETDGTHKAITTPSIVVDDGGTIEVDTINEATTGAGVTVDSVLIKGGLIQHTGAVQQVVYTQTGAVATGSTAFVTDDTIPQNTEGDEFMTLAITPKSTTNVLVIEVSCTLASNAANKFVGGALFQDSTADALAATYGRQVTTADIPMPVIFKHTMVAGTTSATTFKFRGGANTATVTFNGAGGVRRFGGVYASSITITEYKAS